MSRMREFSFHKRSFQIRATAEPDGWAIRIFENGRKVSPLAYKLVYEGEIEQNMRNHPGDFLEHLMTLMQSDVESGRLKIISS